MLPKIVLVKSSDVKGILKKSSSPPPQSSSSTTATTQSSTEITDDSTIIPEFEKSKSSGRLISWSEKLFDVRYFEVEPSNNMTKSTSRLRQEVHQKVCHYYYFITTYNLFFLIILENYDYKL